MGRKCTRSWSKKNQVLTIRAEKSGFESARKDLGIQDAKTGRRLGQQTVFVGDADAGRAAGGKRLDNRGVELGVRAVAQALRA